MRIYRRTPGILIEHGNQFFELTKQDWNSFINRKNLYKSVLNDLSGLQPIEAGSPLDQILLPAVDQEIWASGVTYLRSKVARMEESKDAGGGTFYDRVYDADRPELFFKATAQRAVPHLGTVRIRKDSGWDVPEPELTLLISSEATIEGYTIGNDMSSRSIEGENPLYLPQAKTYDGSASLGPCIFVSETGIPENSLISLAIYRAGRQVFTGEVPISNMKRKHQDLVDYLFRECSFPLGCFLMTGTGIIPPDEFTLQVGDEVRITIENIGTLVNYVG